MDQGAPLPKKCLTGRSVTRGRPNEVKSVAGPIISMSPRRLEENSMIEPRLASLSMEQNRANWPAHAPQPVPAPRAGDPDSASFSAIFRINGGTTRSCAHSAGFAFFSQE